MDNSLSGRYQVPHDAAMRVDEWNRRVYYTWERDGQRWGVHYPLDMFVEITTMGSWQSQWIPRYPIQEPPPPPPREPASLFAHRELTEDELLDPSLFCRSTYEPILDKMVV